MPPAENRPLELGERLRAYAPAPDDRAWDRIAFALDAQAARKRKARLFSVAAAAAVVLLACFSFFLLLKPTGYAPPLAETRQTAPQPGAGLIANADRKSGPAQTLTAQAAPGDDAPVLKAMTPKGKKTPVALTSQIMLEELARPVLDTAKNHTPQYHYQAALANFASKNYCKSKQQLAAARQNVCPQEQPLLHCEIDNMFRQLDDKVDPAECICAAQRMN